MNIFILVNPGLGSLAQKEVEEILAKKAIVRGQVVEADVGEEELEKLRTWCQSARRICIGCGAFDSYENVDFSSLDLTTYLAGRSFKVEVENVKGNENRIKIAGAVAAKIFTELKKQKLESRLEMKKHDVLMVIYYNEGKYYVGLDLCVKELNARGYRVFTGSTSFKGDYAYYFVRSSALQKGESILIAFCKDGTIAIEAARYNCVKVFAFDENMRNVTAAKKNAAIAGVKEKLEICRYNLDEMDTRYDKESFDRVVFQLTTKDEDRLHEAYHQADYVLKKKGTALFITREKFELPVPSQYKLLKEEIIKRGESVSKLWLVEKL